MGPAAGEGPGVAAADAGGLLPDGDLARAGASVDVAKEPDESSG